MKYLTTFLNSSCDMFMGDQLEIFVVSVYNHFCGLNQKPGFGRRLDLHIPLFLYGYCSSASAKKIDHFRFRLQEDTMQIYFIALRNVQNLQQKCIWC